MFRRTYISRSSGSLPKQKVTEDKNKAQMFQFSWNTYQKQPMKFPPCVTRMRSEDSLKCTLPFPLNLMKT